MAYYVIYVPRPLPHALPQCVCEEVEGGGTAKGLRNGYLGSPSLRTLLAANGGKGTANVLIKVKLGILSGNPQSSIPLHHFPCPLPCTISANNNSGSYSQQSTRNWQLAAGFSLSQMLRIRSVKLCPCLRHKHTHTHTYTSTRTHERARERSCRPNNYASCYATFAQSGII